MNGRLPLVALAGLIAFLVAAPVVALGWIALHASEADALAHLLQTVLPRYALNSLMLTALVAGLVTVLGVGTGWLVAAYTFPGRRWLEVALVLPLAMPAFVMAYAYTDVLDTSGPVQTWLRALTGRTIAEPVLPPIRSLPGAALLLGLALYPYVYMLARNAFADRNASLIEAARVLGQSPSRVWWRVTWPVARPAIVAGLTLVVMETLADFGTVSFFAVDTFASGIYRAWQGLGDRVTAARLAVVLLGLVWVLVWVERQQRGRMAFFSRGGRRVPPQPLQGVSAWAASVACLIPVLLGFAVPALLLARVAFLQGDGPDPRLLQWGLNTALLAACAVTAVLPLALGLAYAVRLTAGRLVPVLAALASSGYAVPGVVLAVGLLTLVGAVDRSAGALGVDRLLLGGTAVAVVYAYCVRFFAVAQQGIDAALRRISPSMDASARTLGSGHWETLRRVHVPLLKSSLATAALLVFVDCLKELPATLILRPFDLDTLAVVAYQFAADERLGEAALPSLAIVMVSLVPVIWLARSVRRS